MFEIGGSLAAARQAQGLGLPEVEAMTRIRVAQLLALEEERFDEFPGPAYARAFLRTYARSLGLDADRFVEEFRSRFDEPQELLPLPVAERWRPTSRALALAVSATALAGAVGLFAIFGGFSSGGARIGAVAAGTGGSSPPPSSRPTPSRAKHRSGSPSGAPAASHHRRASRGGRLLIRAVNGPCWLEVRRGGPSGPLLYESTLEPGESVHFGSAPVWVRFGAPGNVVATRGGRSVPGLTGGGPIDLTA